MCRHERFIHQYKQLVMSQLGKAPLLKNQVHALSRGPEECGDGGGGANGEKWRKMAKNGEKWRKMAMANSAFSFVKFAIFRQFLILEFHI